jgi:hypothetical protein
MALVDRAQACLREPEWAGRGTLVEELIADIRDLEQELSAYVVLETEELIPLVRNSINGSAEDEPSRIVAE